VLGPEFLNQICICKIYN